MYNNGEMYRDFTYVSDLVSSIADLLPLKPNKGRDITATGDSLVAPFRVINIGNSSKVRLLDFIEAIEDALGIVASKNLMPMQLGDVPSTHADVTQLLRLTGNKPTTPYKEGVREFVDWYRSYFGV